MATMALLIYFLFLVAHVNGHSLEVEYNPERPLSRMQLHRQLTALNSDVNISVTPKVLGAKVGANYCDRFGEPVVVFEAGFMCTTT